MSGLASAGPENQSVLILEASRNALAMVEMGCRPQLIHEITGVGLPTIRGMVERLGGNAQDKGGRLPRSSGPLLERTQRHVPASLFLEKYVELLEIYGAVAADQNEHGCSWAHGRVVHANAFIRALMQLRASGAMADLTADHANWVAQEFHLRRVSLSPCRECGTQYMYAVQPVVTARRQYLGVCPLCRERDDVCAGREPATATTEPVEQSLALAEQPGGALKSTTASDVVGSLKNALALAELKCRAQLIYQLTAVQMPIIRSMIARVGGVTNDRGGRHPNSLANVLESIDLHVEASYFIKHYVDILAMYGGGRGVIHTDSFIRALICVRGAYPACGLSPDHAYLVVQQYHEGAVALKKCAVVMCPTTYMVTTTPQAVRTIVTSGECPLCRQLHTMHKGRASIKVADPKRQRQLLSALAGR